MPDRFHVIGPGRAGGSVARLLAKAGWEVGILVCREEEQARAAAARLGAGRPSTDALAAFEDEALTIVGLPDRELAPAALRWAAKLPTSRAVVLHLSGGLPSSVLAPLRDRGCALGSLHPAHAFADRERPAASLRGVTFAIEGDDRAREFALKLVTALEGRSLVLDAPSKVLHHAASAVASNFLVTVFDLARRIEESAGVPERDAREALIALVQSTVNNLEKHGSPAALTGPIERGDLEVIDAHLRALSAGDAATAALYRTLGLATVEVAVAKGALAQADASRLRERLRGAP